MNINSGLLTAKVLQMAMQEQKFNAFRHIYPDTGPLRRDLYAVHQQILEAGKDTICRYVLGGNRCLTFNSVLETDRGERQCHELLGETDFYVNSWDGSSRCTKRTSGIFFRGLDQAFQLGLGNGQVFQCSGMHRVWTGAEWLSVDSLIRRANGLHWTGKQLNLRSNYGEDAHLDGERLHAFQGFDLAEFHKQRDAPNSDLNNSNLDEAASKSAHNHVFQSSDLLSMQGGQRPLWDLFERYPSHQFSEDISRQLRRKSQEFRQLRAEYGLSQAKGQFEIWLRENVQFEVLLALGHIPLWASTEIEYIIPIGYRPIIDLEIEDTHCYVSQGLLSHNCGKTRGIGAFEMAQHATGRYRNWWTGYKIPAEVGPPELWVSGKSNEWLRDNAWRELLGPEEERGTGMIPKEAISHIEKAPGGGAGFVSRVWVNHASGGKAVIGAKTWNQGRDAYAGTYRPFIWLDEEHPKEVVDECRLRLTSTVMGRPNGRLLCTLTPLDGITEFIQDLLSGNDSDSRRVFYITWDDVPHLTEEAKRIMADGFGEIQKKARMRGIPEFGEGQVYPYSEESYLEDPFEIPAHWPRIYGFDPKWGRTGGVWLARDLDTDIIHVYGDYAQENREVAIHCSAIKAKGAWIPGVFDYAGADISDGEKLFSQYASELPTISRAEKAVFSGIAEIQKRFANGTLKVSRQCGHLRKELPLYRMKNGKIVKEMDDCLDALRYAIVGIAKAKTQWQTKPQPSKNQEFLLDSGRSSWMG